MNEREERKCKNNKNPSNFFEYYSFQESVFEYFQFKFSNNFCFFLLQNPLQNCPNIELLALDTRMASNSSWILFFPTSFFPGFPGLGARSLKINVFPLHSLKPKSKFRVFFLKKGRKRVEGRKKSCDKVVIFERVSYSLAVAVATQRPEFFFWCFIVLFPGFFLKVSLHQKVDDCAMQASTSNSPSPYLLASSPPNSVPIPRIPAGKWFNSSVESRFFSHPKCLPSSSSHLIHQNAHFEVCSL